MEIGLLIKMRRISMGLSGRQLAERIGVSHSYVSQIERGVIKKPSPAVLRRVARVLTNCDIKELLSSAGYIEVKRGASSTDSPSANEGTTQSRLQPFVSEEALKHFIDAARRVLKSAELIPVERAQPSETINIPLFSTVPASFQDHFTTPVLPYEEYEMIKVLEANANYDPDCFALRVKGDSMKDAGILPGDIVVVSPNTPYESGDICVVRVSGECSIKRVIISGGFIVLQAANSNYEPMVITNPKEEDLFIYGKVIHVQRSLI